MPRRSTFCSAASNATTAALRAGPPIRRSRAVLIGGLLLAALTAIGFDQPGSALAPITSPSSDQTPPADQVRKVVNPHWTSAGCVECHPGGEERVQPVPPETVDALCMKCHDGQLAKMESHPVGRYFSSEQVVLPDGWPAPDERLGCLTCHEVLAACDKNKTRAPYNPAFLRGPDVFDPITFCGKCHVETLHERYNPHVMLSDTGSVAEAACRFCHTADLDTSSQTRSKSAALHTEELTMCMGCHPQHIDYFEPGHVGAVLPPEMKAQWARATGLGPTIQGEALSGLLPLGAGDRVLCSTCHNPHQRGVFANERVLSAGAIRPNRTAGLVALRLGGKELCVACHKK